MEAVSQPPGSKVWVVGLCISGLVALAGSALDSGELSGWIWLALWAVPGGALAGARLAPRLQTIPLVVWLAGAWWLAADLPDPGSALLAIAALYVLGLAVHGGPGVRAWSLAASAFMVVGLLVALPSGGGALAQPFSPVTTARFLDLSPLVWVMECAGIDWMRHPSVYELAGAADIGPDLRISRSGSKGPLLVLSLAIGLVFLRAVFAQRAMTRA